jgi:hypothetical protein
MAVDLFVFVRNGVHGSFTHIRYYIQFSRRQPSQIEYNSVFLDCLFSGIVCSRQIHPIRTKDVHIFPHNYYFVDNQETKTKTSFDFVDCRNVFVAVCSVVHSDDFAHKCISFATFHFSDLFDWVSTA